MNRIALALVVLVLGIAGSAHAQPKKRAEGASVKKTLPTPQTLEWARDASGTWSITPAEH